MKMKMKQEKRKLDHNTPMVWIIFHKKKGLKKHAEETRGSCVIFLFSQIVFFFCRKVFWKMSFNERLHNFRFNFRLKWIVSLALSLVQNQIFCVSWELMGYFFILKIQRNELSFQQPFSLCYLHKYYKTKCKILVEKFLKSHLQLNLDLFKSTTFSYAAWQHPAKKCINPKVTKRKRAAMSFMPKITNVYDMTREIKTKTKSYCFLCTHFVDVSLC